MAPDDPAGSVTKQPVVTATPAPAAQASSPPPPRGADPPVDPGRTVRSGGAELWATRAVANVVPLVRRIPFTATVVSITLVVGLLARTIFVPVSQETWYPYVAYGLPALREGRVWTLVTGGFFAISPVHYLTAILVFGVLVGACEIRLGTRRTAVTCIVGEIGGILAASLLMLALSNTSWQWAQTVATVRDVGFTTGMLTVVAVTSALLRSPWRLRVRAVLGFYVAVAFLFEGTLSDVAHLLAVAVGVVVGQRLYGVEPGFGPRTRRETRLMAFAALLAIAAVEITVLLFPGDGPLGSTAGQAGPTVDVIIDVVIIALLANQLRYGRRWAWWVAVVLSAFNVAVAILVLVLLVTGQPVTGAPVSLGSGLLWVGVLLLLLFNRRAFGVPLRRRVVGGVSAGPESTARARQLLMTVGGSTMSWMTLWPENRYYFTADGDGYVGYQRHAGVAIALADPVVPAGTEAAAVTEFATVVERGGLTPCLFSVGEAVAQAARDAGWRATQIAEDTIVDLPGLVFKGKSWQDIRSAINKAKREQLEFQLVSLAEQPFAVLAQVRAISEQWVGEKGLPEMGFTLGGVEESLDPAVRVGLAIDRTGSIHGVTSWLPVYGPGGVVRGWTLDVMRRRPDGFRPAVEFMIAQACLAFQAEGAQFVSLSGAPLARSRQPEEALPQIDRVLDALGGALEPLYGFRSLHAFKEKFKPRHETIYLAYRDESDLPRIGLALTRAYLPDASPGQLVKASLATRSHADASAR